MFDLTKEQREKLETWRKEQDAVVLKRQQESDDEMIREMCAMWKRPYYGCCGGELTFMFTPTTIGLGVAVKHSGTGETLDLTDYDSW